MKKGSWLPVLPLAILVLTQEFLVRTGLVRPYLLPAPSSVLISMFDSRAELARAMLSTAESAVAGFALSATFGSLIAVLLSTSRTVQRAFYPYIVFLQTVPLIAIAPLLVIWFGFGIQTTIATAFISSLFPVIANTLDGILSTDLALQDLFRLYGATPLITLLKLRLPAAMPQIFSGLQISAGLAVIGSIVGEFIGGGGLGSVIDVARTQQRVDKVFAAVLLASFMGLVLFEAVKISRHLVLRRWHASEQTERE